MSPASWGRLVPFAVGVAAVTLVAVISMVAGDLYTGLALALAAAGLAWWSWPGRHGAHVGHGSAREQATPEDVIVYWRPGCSFCAALKLRLGRDRRRVTWVNIWQDEDAAAFVRSVRDGNETVPTAVCGDGTLIPAEPGPIRARLAHRSA